MFSSNAYGSYGGGPGAYASAYGALSSANISFETNSKDPFLQRARVFVGNIITTKVGREEIIQLFSNYGKLLGVTVFKGYAFVQFSYGTEADLAVSALNGYNWHGATLDVKLAMHGQQPTAAAATPAKSIFGAFPIGAAKNTGKRNKNEVPQQEATPAKDLKRMKIDQGGGDSAAGGPGGGGASEVTVAKNSANKTFAANTAVAMDSTGIGAVAPHGDDDILDTLICGGCRFVTHSLAEFVTHRKQPCKLAVKTVGEPDVLGCISCDQQFESSWALLSHHNTAHIRPLFKAIDAVAAAASQSTTTNGAEQQNNIQQQRNTEVVGGKQEKDDEPMMASNAAGEQQQTYSIDLADELFEMAVSTMNKESDDKK